MRKCSNASRRLLKKHRLAVRVRDRRARRHAVDVGVPHADSAVCCARTDSSGYSPGRDYEYVEINRVLRTMHPEVVAETIGAIERLGGTVRADPTTDLLTVNDEFTASIVISRSFQTSAGAFVGRFASMPVCRPDITVALRMDAANRAVVDYYLLPAHRHSGGDGCGSERRTGSSLDAYRFDSLESFFYLAARTRIRMAA